jgi:hypothetical protein
VAKTLAQLSAVVRQKSNTDGVSGGNQVVTDAELAGYINEAVRELYDMIVGVDSSYYQSSFDFTLANSATGNVATLPGDFYKERGLVLFPDTERETPVYSVPFAERTRGKLGFTLDGNNVRVFPWQLAGQGPWRLYYTPKAPTFDQHTVRLVTTGVLPAIVASGGPGPGKTLTATANGALIVDGTNAAAGDRILLTDVAAGGPSTLIGIFDVVSAGSAGTKFVLTRSSDFDQAQAGEVVTGATVLVTAGATMLNTSWQLGAFTGPVDTGNMTWSLTTLDVTMDNFDTYITAKAALMVYAKRQMDPGAVPGLLAAAEQRVMSMATARVAEPEQAPVLWRGSRRGSRYFDDLA